MIKKNAGAGAMLPCLMKKILKLFQILHFFVLTHELLNLGHEVTVIDNFMYS